MTTAGAASLSVAEGQGPVGERELAFMRRALAAAELAGGRGEVPVGAVVVVGDQVVAVAHNERETGGARALAAARRGPVRHHGAVPDVRRRAGQRAHPAALLRLRRSEGGRGADPLHAGGGSAPESPGRGVPGRARGRGRRAAARVLL